MVTVCSAKRLDTSGLAVAVAPLAADWGPGVAGCSAAFAMELLRDWRKRSNPQTDYFFFLQAVGLGVCLSPKTRPGPFLHGATHRNAVGKGLRIRPSTARTRVGLDGPHHLPGQNPQYAPAFALDTRPGILAQRER